VGRHEVVDVRVVRIPGPVLRTLELRHAVGVALRLERGAGLGRRVAERVDAEARAFRDAGRRSLEREAVDLQAVERAPGEAGLLDRVARRLLVAGIDVDLAAVAALVVLGDDDRAVAGAPV